MTRGVHRDSPSVVNCPRFRKAFLDELAHIRLREAHRVALWTAKRRREAAYRYARSELARQVPVSRIMSATGLTYEQVKKLQADVERKCKRSPLVHAQPTQWWR